MELLSNLELALVTALQFDNLLFCTLGVLIGMFVGVLPGIGHMAAITVLMPLTYYVPSTAALVMLAGIYYGAQYGGSIASILLNMPGTASTAVTCLDGYPMTRQGRAGVALFMTTVSSFVGSLMSIVALVALAPTLASFALKLISVDYFSMLMLGLVATAAMVAGNPFMGTASVCLGLALGLVGTDVNTGMLRFTFGVPQLFDGVNIVILAMSFLGLAEIIRSSKMGTEQYSLRVNNVTLRSLMPKIKDLRDSVWPTIRGGFVGIAVGILPGAGGGSMASLLSYAVERRVTRHPERFGKGAIEGITGPESANNATAQAAFIPTLTLGIPGDAIMALMLGALMIHGIQPGPRVISENPELFWGLVGSFVIGNLLLVILNIPLIRVWVEILRIPPRLLFPAVVTIVAVGAYSLSISHMDVLFVALFALAGYILVELGFEPAPVLLGFILGPLLEENFRRAMIVSDGSLAVFIERPVSATMLAFCALSIGWSIYGAIRKRKKGRSTSTEPVTAQTDA